jgi:hypothetical protein
MLLPGSIVKPRHILTHLLYPLECGLEEHWGQYEDLRVDPAETAGVRFEPPQRLYSW